MIDFHAYSIEWCKAWNAHDLDRLLDGFDDSVVFKSPAARKIVPGSDGVIVGKAALRSYWSEGLRLIPNLHFTLVGIYEGIDCVTIAYRNQDGRQASEVLVFSDGLVVQGFGTYLVSPSS